MSEASVLIVEDEAIVVADLAIKLEHLGYRVAGSTGTGEEAVRVAAQERPSLVLMDIRLGGEMDGIEAAAVIRRDSDLPVVFLTAHSEPTTLELAGEAEAFGYILKPFQERELDTQIRMALYRHAAERRLRESEERYRALYENAPTAYFSVASEDGRILRCNRMAEALLGYDRESLRRKNVLDLYADTVEGKSKAQTVLERFKRGETIRDVELQMKHKAGHPIWISLSVEPLRDAEGNVLESRSVAVDITDRKRNELEMERLNISLEQQVAERTRSLRRATSELLLAEEGERRRLAREVHDSLGQELALARLKLGALAMALDSGDTDGARDDAEKAAFLIEQADRSSRALIHQLSPHALDEADLVRAVRSLAEQFHDLHGLQVDTSGVENGFAAADEETRMIVYRAVRELLFNVAKHAVAKDVSVKITRHDDQIRVTVRDVGVGFDLAASTRGDGLINTRERIEHLGGTLQVESAPGRGTTAIIEVPL